jgi:fibronectin type 3 domain-containing protein
MRRHKILFILIAFVLCLVLPSCALPTSALPPQELEWEEDATVHPPPPQNLRATIEGTRVHLEWDRPLEVTEPHSYDDEIAYYRVFRRRADSADSELIGKVEELTFVDMSPPSEQVFYRVAAVHADELEGSLSDEVEVTLVGADGEQSQSLPGLMWEDDVSVHPPPPQNLRATVEGGRVRLEWDRPLEVTEPHSYDDEIAYYRVFRRRADSADSEPIGQTEELTFVDTSPPPGQVFYRVTAVHVGEYEGSRSDEIQVVPEG